MIRGKTEKRVMGIDKRKQYKKHMSQRSPKEITGSRLYKELENYRKAGITLWLNGKKSTSYGIANYVREEADFMRDYYFDRNHDICGIGFDRIRD